MGVNRGLSRLLGPIVIGFAIVGPMATASAATPVPRVAVGHWQHSIAQVPAPGRGCYHASYPALEWRAVPCEVGPRWPLTPGPVAGSPPLRGPFEAVGDGNDYSAVVSGTISQATGSFNDVSPGITETGQIDDKGSQVANAFTLQLNSEFFSSPACSQSSDPANCLGWQQFIYETSSNVVFMQYWLINYDATCPSGWFSFKGDCYVNSPASTYSAGPLTAAGLASVKLAGTATSGGDDEVSLSAGSGTATMVSNSDDVVDLANSWNTTEFDVFGDGGGGQANFGPDTKLDAETMLVDSSPDAPTCTEEGFTGETNNLSLSGSPALGARQLPTIESAQSNGTATTPTCATAGSDLSETATELSAAPSNPATNQTVTLTATVTPGSATPAGTVGFDNNGAAISGCAAQPVALNGSAYTATCRTSFTAASSPEVLSASFTPSGSSGGGASMSSGQTLVVARNSTATSLGVSTATPVVDQGVIYTATVTPSDSGSALPSGSVEFLDGSSPISACSSRPLSGGAANCTVSYASKGSHSITATYLGDASFTRSPSSAQTVVVAQPVPANSSPPTITGTTRQGLTLTESHGTWSNIPASYTYQWEDCDGGGASCSAIAGATSQSYTLGISDIGHTIRVVETASNAGGAGIPASSGATAVIAAQSTTAAPPTAAPPNRADVNEALDRMLKPSGKAARIVAILRAGGYAYTFTAPSAGTLVVAWYATVKGKKILVALMKRVIHLPGKAREKLKLTSKGRRLLKTVAKAKILGTAVFTPTSTTSTTASRRFTLKG